MVLRLSAAICGVEISFLFPAAMARSKVCAGHSCAVDRPAVGTAIVGVVARRSSAWHRCTIRFGPDIEREAQELPRASAMMRRRGQLRSR